MSLHTETLDTEKVSILIKNYTEAGALKHLADAFGHGVTFSTSFRAEDQVISHLIFSQQLPIDVFTLDTCRLFPETYSTWSATLEKYGSPITAYYPNATDLQQYVKEKGPNSFYERVENRKSCCHIRKVEPLQRALAGKKNLGDRHQGRTQR